MKANLSKFQSALNALRSAAPAAREETARDGVHAMAKELMRATPRDTNRMAAAFAQAFNEAGAGPFLVPRITGSRHYEKQIQKMEKQRAGLRSFMDYYIRTGRYNQPYYRKLVKWHQRACEELAKLMDLGPGGGALLIENRDRRVSLTIRAKVYGGAGSVKRSGTRVLYTFRNKEPHAIIIDRRRGLVQRAIETGNGYAKRRGKRVYLRNLRRRGAKAVKA